MLDKNWLIIVKVIPVWLKTFFCIYFDESNYYSRVSNVVNDVTIMLWLARDCGNTEDQTRRSIFSKAEPVNSWRIISFFLSFLIQFFSSNVGVIAITHLQMETSFHRMLKKGLFAGIL